MGAPRQHLQSTRVYRGLGGVKAGVFRDFSPRAAVAVFGNAARVQMARTGQYTRQASVYSSATGQ